MQRFYRHALPLLLIAASTLVRPAAAAEVCDGSDPKLTPSPDGRFVASVQERVCSVGRGAAAAITVIVSPPDRPGEATRVAATAVPRSRDEWPRVVWRSPTRLEVWVPNMAHVLETKTAAGDVQVSLHYCADNPDDRARVADYQAQRKRWMEETTAWAQRRKEAPGTEGPRPLRPEEPRVARGVCTEADLAG